MLTRNLRRAIVGIAAACVAAVGVSGQQAQPPTFRAGVLLVPVDVRVVDAQGNPITDLTASDFTILEDGVPQKIAEFSTRAYTAESAVPRTFAILLGGGNHDPSKAIDAIINLVRSELLPTDRVSVMAYLHVAEPTTDHAGVLRLLERYRVQYRNIEGRLHRDQARLFGPNLPLSPDTRSAIEQLFEGTGLPPIKNLPDGAGGKGLGYADLTYLVRAIEFLRRVDGEKHLLAILDRRIGLGRDGASWMSAKAAAARVTVSVITTGGSESSQAMIRGHVSPGRAPSAWEYTSDVSKSIDDKDLAELTGGLAAFYQDVRKPLSRIARTTAFDYLLGYYPAVPPLEGEYRALKIIVDRRGATVLYRHGYESRPKTDEPYDVRAMFTESRILQAASSSYGFAGFPVKIAASVTNGDPASVAVDLTIDPRRVTFTESGDRYTAALDVAVYVADAREKMLAEKRDRIELNVDAAALARVKKELIRRTVTFTLSGKPDQVKVVVYDYDADRLGSASVRVRSSEAAKSF